MSRDTPVSLARAEKIVAQCAGLRDPSMPLIFARGEHSWRVTYDAGRSWVSIASIEDSAKTLRERIAAAMGSPYLEHDDGGSRPLGTPDEFIAWQQAGNKMSDSDAGAATNGLTVALIVLVVHRSGNVSLLSPFAGEAEIDDEGDQCSVIHVPCAKFVSGEPATQQMIEFAQYGTTGIEADSDAAGDIDAVNEFLDGMDGLSDDLGEFASSTGVDEWLAAWLGSEDLNDVECATHVLFTRAFDGGWHCCAVEGIYADDGAAEETQPLVCGTWSQMNDPAHEGAYAKSERSLNHLFAICRPVPGNPYAEPPQGPDCSCMRYTAEDVITEASDTTESGEAVESLFGQAHQLAYEALVALDEVREGFSNEQFVELCERLLRFAATNGEDLLPVVSPLCADAAVRISGLMDDLIGYGCDPDETLCDSIEADLDSVSRAALLWCSARSCSLLAANAQRIHGKGPLRIQKSGNDALVRILTATSEEIGDSAADGKRSVDLLLRRLRKAQVDAEYAVVPEGKRLHSLSSKALRDLASCFSAMWHEVAYGAYARLPVEGWHSPNGGGTWMIEVNDDLPRLLVVHGPDFPEPRITLMPPLQGPLMSAWETRGCARSWADIAERHAEEVAMMPVGEIYETCGECGCPLPSDDKMEYASCPVCGNAVAVQSLPVEGKSAHAASAAFSDGTAAAKAAVALGHEFVKWRDDLAASTAWI